MADISAELIRIAARSVRVWRGGNGLALLLLHGGVGDAELHWRPVWNRLADSFSVAAPTLVVWGSDDRHSPVERGQAVAEQIPGAQFRTLAHAGHLPQLEQPAEFIALVQEFCAG